MIAGAGVFCELFSFYSTVGQYKSAFDGEIEAVLIALKQLNYFENKFEKSGNYSQTLNLLSRPSPILPYPYPQK